MAAAPAVRRSELAEALRACRSAFIGVGLISCMINLLYLTGSMFMLQVYDRVLPSRSVPTLVGLVVIAAVLYMAQGVLDLLRGRILGRVGTSLDEALNARVFDTIVRLPLMAGNRSEGLQPLRDLDNVRSFLGSMGPGAFFDLPWLPFYMLICFAFHWLLGVTALIGAVILVTLTLITEYMSRTPAREAMSLAARRNDLAASSRRNAEVLVAMGMAGRMNKRWNEANEEYLSGNQRASDVSGGLGAVAKVLRMMLQSAVLAVGAYLVIHQEATGGIIIAGSILSARALAPVDLAIAHWKSFVAARQSWQRLNRLLQQIPARPEQTLLQAPEKKLSVEAVTMVAPGDQRPIVQDVTFAVEAGSGVGVIGPSGSGKSSLIRALVGVWVPARGKVRLDGAALDQWSSDQLGRHVGYLPQDVELFAGTVAQNICRFDPDAKSDGIIAAAKEAGVHEMIIKMREGYDTQVGEQGTALSAGQAQRVALARALYGNPFLIVLDEPNSNLDSEGDEALTRAVRGAPASAAPSSSWSHTGRSASRASTSCWCSRTAACRPSGRRRPCSRRCCSASRRRCPHRSRSSPMRGRPSHERPHDRSAAQRTCFDQEAPRGRPRRGPGAGRRRRRLGRDGADLGRADRAGLGGGRYQRQEGAASDRRRRRRNPGARRRHGQGG
ncbi:PrtD family type I secretion system ABC transporter [Bradyrhizobium sp. JR6.1]